MKMKVVGKEFDLATVVPVTIGDLKKLKRTYNLSEKELAAGDVTASAALLLVLLQKLDKDLTEEQLDTLSIADAEEAFQFLAATGRKIDRPI